MSFVLSAVLTLGILLGSHYLLFFTSVRVYDIKNSKARLALLSVISVLAISFFLSALFLRLSNSILSIAFSWIASLWMGLWLHLLAALVVFWLVHAVACAMGSTPKSKLLWGGLIAVCTIVTAYGTANAFSVRTTHLDIQIPNLPDQWREQTVVQLSDVHLGSIRGKRFLKRIIDNVNSLDPELIVITGDLFDGMGADLVSFADQLSTLRAPKGVLFVTGNHEGYLGLTEPLDVVRQVGIQVLDDEVVDVDGLQVAGASFPESGTLNKSRSVARMGRAIDPEKPCILLYHTPTDVAESNSGRADQQTSTYLSPDVDFSFAREFRVDLQLSGHTHEGQFFPFTYLTEWIFGGYHYGLHNVDGFSIYITSGTGTWGPPLRTGSRSEIVAIRLQ